MRRSKLRHQEGKQVASKHKSLKAVFRWPHIPGREVAHIDGRHPAPADRVKSRLDKGTISRKQGHIGSMAEKYLNSFHRTCHHYHAGVATYSLQVTRQNWQLPL